MKPTPQQLIDGVRALLRDHIGPELQTGEAKAHLRKVMALLREADWDEAGFELLRENEALEDLLSGLSEWCASHPALGIGAPKLPQASPGDPGFAAAQARRLALREALASFTGRCVEAGERCDGQDGAAPQLAALRRRIALVLAQACFSAPRRPPAAPLR